MTQPTWCKLRPDQFPLLTEHAHDEVPENVIFMLGGSPDPPPPRPPPPPPLAPGSQLAAGSGAVERATGALAGSGGGSSSAGGGASVAASQAEWSGVWPPRRVPINGDDGALVEYDSLEASGRAGGKPFVRLPQQGGEDR